MSETNPTTACYRWLRLEAVGGRCVVGIEKELYILR